MAKIGEVDLSTRGKRCMFWGPSGGGKTWLAGSASKPYIFDLDAGISTLVAATQRGTFDFSQVQFDEYDPIDPEGWRKFDMAFKEFERNPKRDDVDTVVVDSMTTIQPAIQNNVQLLNSSVGQQMTLPQWGMMIRDIETLMYRFCNLSKKGYNVILTAHSQMEKDELTGMLREMPVVVGKALPGKLPIWFDEAYYCYADLTKDGLGGHYIQTVGDKMKHGIKSRLGGLSSVELVENKALSNVWEHGGGAGGGLTKAQPSTSASVSAKQPAAQPAQTRK